MPEFDAVGAVLASFAGAESAYRFYVDLAANHPITGSATFGLDQSGWRGLCIEPNPMYTKLLREMRNCSVAETAVDETEHVVTFHFGAGEMGGIEDPRFDNRRAHRKRDGSVQTLTTRRLHDVLRDAGAPTIIDFLNLDVEGAETAVLSTSFAWEQYTFLTLSIERPPPDLNARLFSHGYLFVRTLGLTDTFYVHRSHPRAHRVARNSSFEQLPAKCGNGKTTYTERTRLVGVRCESVFGCCEYVGYPQATTRYAGLRRASARRSSSAGDRGPAKVGRPGKQAGMAGRG